MIPEEIRTKIIARAWKDPAFKERLLNNPKEALKEYGLDTPITIVEETPSTLYLILPEPPSNYNKLSEAELEKLAAAQCCGFTETLGP